MIKKLQFYISNTFDPYINLSAEKLLFDSVDGESLILYLWQNQNTVVIGKNQNAFSECRTELLKKEGGKLARRLSGGGAVFHDLGNLNFTFLCSTENLDIAKHMQVIREACRMAGITAELSGRNDILADGRKFSGNAFYNSRGHSYHHGTILIHADMDKLGRYLTPPKAKLESKGVKSVRSRVVNLSSLAPSLTCEQMKGYLLTAFEEIYGLKPEKIEQIDSHKISALAEQYGSPDYLFGSPIPFNVSCRDRLCFGNTEIQMQVSGGKIQEIRVYTDALDVELSETISHALAEQPFELSAISRALDEALSEQITTSIISMFNNQIFS
jgi:lipoate-protein ligase A